MTETETLHLSRLVPDMRSRRARSLIAAPGNLYGVLLEAFAEPPPHHTGGGPDSTPSRGLLFRIEPAGRDRPLTVLVQSPAPPDWQRFQFRCGDLFDPDHQPETKPFSPVLRAGMELRFRLRANPTHARVQHGLRPCGKRQGGKHLPVTGEAEQREWLERKLGAVAELVDFRATDERDCHFRGRRDAKARVRSVLYEGILRVLEPDDLLNLMATGVGRGRAFGFGLLSLAPA